MHPYLDPLHHSRIRSFKFLHVVDQLMLVLLVEALEVFHQMNQLVLSETLQRFSLDIGQPVGSYSIVVIVMWSDIAMQYDIITRCSPT